MNPLFSIKPLGSLESLGYQPWREAGVVHGMTTSSLAFNKDKRRQGLDLLRSALGVDHILLPDQSHGCECFDAREAGQVIAILERHGDLLQRVSADAVIAPLKANTGSLRLAYGVMSADCVPLIVSGSDGVALIHAGWRGLANGIIQKAVSILGAPSAGIILGCAGGEVYQVGSEVLEAIGDSAVYSRRADGGLFLDTAQTAAVQLRAAAPGIKVELSGVCTISDRSFHSYRRDGDKAGRCVSFYKPSLIRF
jgi:copper oxidase (laccase) domain-containing protein